MRKTFAEFCAERGFFISAAGNACADEWRLLPEGNLQPLHDKLVVEPIESDTMIGGLLIPETAREKPMKGIVIATGPKVGVTLKVGDIVLYGKHIGVDITHEGKDCLLLREADVFAII